MTVGFGKLDLKKIRHVIYDLDNCLFMYPGGYVDQFSIETANSAIRAAREETLTNGDQKLLDLLEMDFDDVVSMSKNSYAQYGDTTTVFERDYGLNAIKLYDDHHITIADGIIKNAFHRLARHGLRQGMVMIHNLGIQQHLFTNGTEYYAKVATGKLGVSDCLKTIVGIDSYDDIGHPSGAPEKKGKVILFPKHMRAAWHDALELMKIPTYVSDSERQDGTLPFVIGQEKEFKTTYKYWNYPNTIFFDDSPENLAMAKSLGIQTVLVKTDRVKYDPDTMPYIDAVADNIDIFLCLMANELENLNSSEVENRRDSVVYKGPKLVVSR